MKNAILKAISTVFTALFALMLSVATPLYAQSAYSEAQIEAAEECGDGRDLEEGQEQLCTCRARGFDRFIWGTGPYSGHSDICTAARHAGLITKEDGGAVVALGRPGQRKYEEGEANGIKGRSWLSFRNSFDVVGVNAGTQAANLLRCQAFSADAAPYDCACPAGTGNTGSVWGTGPYTGDSDVCSAARHAGAVGADGGPIRVTGAAGQDSYDGSDANGVTSRSWGSYGESFNVASLRQASVEECGDLRTDVESYACSCPPGSGNDGSVWGIGPYTGDSDICSAARHAGVVSEAGGAITITLEPGQDSYEGSEANGVTTRRWGSYPRSFALARFGADSAGGPACKTVPSGVDRHSCSCPAQPVTGRVWGSGPYTADSDICTAARHAGVPGGNGGGVTVMVVPGLERYAGSAAGGVTTEDWNRFEASIIFDRN